MHKVTTTVLTCLTIAAAIGLRVWDLGHIPGVNGDEAWYGVLVQRLTDGDADTLWTPTGNLVNPFYVAPLLLLHLVLPPSIPLLRSVAVGSGILALAVNFMLCRRVYGRETALTSTLILAVLPINIAYSRFGWDASQSLLATLPVVYLSLAAAEKGRGVWMWLTAAATALLAATIVHPTNIFVAPFVFLAAALALPTTPAGRRPAKLSRTTWLLAAIVFVAGVLFAVWSAWSWMPPIALRLVDAAQLAEFANRLQRLFTGVTVYQFIPGTFAGDSLDIWSLMGRVAHDLAGLTIVGAGAALLIRKTLRSRDARDRMLLLGCGASVAAFYIVAGPQSIAPHWERYGIGLIAPIALILARSAAIWVSSPKQFGAVAALFGAAWLSLASFSWNYMAAFRSTGGRSHQTFRTGPAEPKAAALSYISNRHVRGEREFIVTTTWWTYWPLAYLANAADNDGIEVRWARDAWTDPAVTAAAAVGRTWVVEFAGSEQAAAAREALRATAAHGRHGESQTLDVECFLAADYSGAGVLSVCRMVPRFQPVHS